MKSRKDERINSASLFRKGDKNVEHWHGATATSKMAHIAINNYKGDENVRWLKPVTDEEFKAINKQ